MSFPWAVCCCWEEQQLLLAGQNDCMEKRSTIVSCTLDFALWTHRVTSAPTSNSLAEGFDTTCRDNDIHSSHVQIHDCLATIFTCRQTDGQTDRRAHLLGTLIKEGQCCALGMCEGPLLYETVEDLSVKEVGEKWPLRCWTVL